MKVDGVQHTRPGNMNKAAAKAAALLLLSASPSHDINADDVIELKPSLEQDTFEFTNPEENEEKQQPKGHSSATQNLIVGITGLLMTGALIKSVIDNSMKSEYIDDLCKKLDEKEEENKKLKTENSNLKENNKNLALENHRLSEDYSNAMSVYGETKP